MDKVASLTEVQSQVVLWSLAAILFLVVIGVVTSLRRIKDLENVVYDSSRKTKKLSEAIDSVKPDTR